MNQFVSILIAISYGLLVTGCRMAGNTDVRQQNVGPTVNIFLNSPTRTPKRPSAIG